MAEESLLGIAPPGAELREVILHDADKGRDFESMAEFHSGARATRLVHLGGDDVGAAARFSIDALEQERFKDVRYRCWWATEADRAGQYRAEDLDGAEVWGFANRDGFVVSAAVMLGAAPQQYPPLYLPERSMARIHLLTRFVDENGVEQPTTMYPPREPDPACVDLIEGSP